MKTTPYYTGRALSLGGMKLVNLLPPMRVAALFMHALTLAVAFTLLVRALGLAPAWLLLGALLAMPGLIALRRPRWQPVARATCLGGLLILVTGASLDLWAGLAGGARLDASLHLLLLALALALAIVHQLLEAPPPAEAERGAGQLLEAALRGPSILAMLCLALLLGGACLAGLHALPTGPAAIIAPKLLERGMIPPLTLNLFLWGMALLAGKWLLTTRELARAADAGGASLFRRAYAQSAGAGDGERQDAFASLLWQQFEAFYTLPRYINWAIPILGFIGTVLGISLATEGLGELLARQEADFSQSLGQALSPLGIAFDTTLIALSLSVVFALCQTLLYRWEERRLLALTEELARHA